jgi:hypothetical protein
MMAAGLIAPMKYPTRKVATAVRITRSQRSRGAAYSRLRRHAHAHHPGSHVCSHYRPNFADPDLHAAQVGGQRRARSSDARCCTATSTCRPAAFSSTNSCSRASALEAVRAFSSGATSPLTNCNRGFTLRAVPSAAEAPPIRPPRRRNSNVST